MLEHTSHVPSNKSKIDSDETIRTPIGTTFCAPLFMAQQLIQSMGGGVTSQENVEESEVRE